MKVTMVPGKEIVTDPDNPRTDITPESLSELTESIKGHSIKVPLIGYATSAGVMIVDGNRRFGAGSLAGLLEFPVIVHPNKPSEAELLATQLTINGHRAALNPADEYFAFSRLLQLNGYSPSELAAELAISASEVTRVLALGKLSPAELQLVRDGRIVKSAAYALSRMEPEKRAAMAQKAANGQVTRDQLDRESRRPQKSKGARLRRISFAVPGGMVSLQSDAGLDLQRAIETLESLVRECRKYRTQGLDITTAVRISKDQSRANPVA
jgi:ParB family chromosome partitioning protein